MSYYSPIDFQPSNKNGTNPVNPINSNNPDIKFNYKNKFVIKTDPSKDVPGHTTLLPKKTSAIDTESNLITPSINSKDKIQLKLKNEFKPSDYSLNYTNSLQNSSKQNNEIYYNNKDVGAGRGFGNLDISNEIRNSGASRADTKEFKEYRESQQLFDFQFQYLDRNVQDPNHLVMPIPRGGETTRKQNQLSVNTMRSTESVNSSDELLKTIKFKY